MCDVFRPKAMRTCRRLRRLQQHGLDAIAAADIDDAERAVALEQGPGELIGGAGEVGDEQVGRTVIDFVRSAHLQQIAFAHHPIRSPSTTASA